jgi:Divergent InlB B-repeat domain
VEEGVDVMRFGLRSAAVVGVCALAGAFASASEAAPWCGSTSVTDRAPAVAGRTIRVVYVIPSDGADRIAELAPRISADIDEIAAWWRTQDPEREPRFDRAAFPCGPQADILTLRLTESAAAMSPDAVRFDRISDAVVLATGSAGFQKHLVYYDGPTDDDRICGQGAGGPDGAGAAIVYLAACSGVPTAAVAAHELLHAFGALAQTGPPNACPDTRGHPCDSDTDILFPYAGTTALGSLVLDYGRNDYYGHAGGWLDVQDSGWLRLVTRQVSLVLGIVGTGSVESDIPGIDCSASCTTEWDAGSTVELEALAGEGQRFVRWSGACSGTVRCEVALAAAASVGALFAPERFGIVVSVTGRGAVTGAGGACRLARCARQATSYVPLRLRAAASKGWRFAGWTGGCSGRSADCTVPMTRATAVRARFVRR